MLTPPAVSPKGRPLMPALNRAGKYGPTHRAQRQAWAPLVAQGTVRCARADTDECVYPDPLIHVDQAWQLDHVEGGSRPSHKRCNLSAGAVYGNTKREPRTAIW